MPEWLLDTDVSDKAIRLFGLLGAKFGNKDGVCFPRRSTLARELGVKRCRSVDVAIRELIAVGAVSKTKRRDNAGIYSSNIYQLHYARPGWCASGDQEGAPLSLPEPGAGSTVGPPTVQDVGLGAGPKPDGDLTKPNDPDIRSAAAASVLSDLRVQFDRIVAVYPRGAAKKAAWREFQVLKPSNALTEEILNAIEFQKRTVWGGVKPWHIPYLGTYLHDERWTDAQDDVAPVSQDELDRARRHLARTNRGHCPHNPVCDTTKDCHFTEALRLRRLDHARHDRTIGP